MFALSNMTCVWEGEIYSLHKLILHVCLERGHSLLLCVCLCVSVLLLCVLALINTKCFCEWEGEHECLH